MTGQLNTAQIRPGLLKANFMGLKRCDVHLSATVLTCQAEGNYCRVVPRGTLICTSFDFEVKDVFCSDRALPLIYQSQSIRLIGADFM